MKEVKLCNDNDRLFVTVKPRWVYFECVVDGVGCGFKIGKDDMVKLLK